jgi:hypothetical protein
MNRMLRPLIAGGLMAAAAASAAGCADNNSTLFIYGVLATVAPLCSVIADPSQAMLGAGALDIALSSNYEGWLLVGNQYSPRGAKQQLKTETTKVTLTGAEITLKEAATDKVISCPNSANCGGPFSVYGSGFANSSRSEDPGWGAIYVQFLPNAVGEFFRAGTLKNPGPTLITVVANIKVYGTTLGNQDVESGTFSYPIQICNGCSIDYQAVDLTTGKCLVQQGAVIPQTNCRVGQDGKTDCRLCLNQPICQCPTCGP